MSHFDDDPSRSDLENFMDDLESKDNPTELGIEGETSIETEPENVKSTFIRLADYLKINGKKKNPFGKREMALARYQDQHNRFLNRSK